MTKKLALIEKGTGNQPRVVGGDDGVVVLSMEEDDDFRGDVDGDRAVMVCHTSNEGTGLPSILPLRQGIGLQAPSSTPQGDGDSMTTTFLGVSDAVVVVLGGTGAFTTCSVIELLTGFGFGASRFLANTSKPSISESNPIIASSDLSGS